MRMGAKITLNRGIGAARDGLAGLADGSWLMRVPRNQDPYRGHPAGHALPVSPAPGGKTVLVAVTFGTLREPVGLAATLSVRWEALEPGSECAVLLDGDIAPAPLPGQARSILTLGGTCRMLPVTFTQEGYQQARLQAIETAQAFITSIAVILAGSPDPGQQPFGLASSWLTGQPQAP